MRAFALGLGLVCISIAGWVLYRSLRNLWRVWRPRTPEVDPEILAVAEEFARLKREHAETLDRTAAAWALKHHANREWVAAHRSDKTGPDGKVIPGCPGCVVCNSMEAN